MVIFPIHSRIHEGFAIFFSNSHLLVITTRPLGFSNNSYLSSKILMEKYAMQTLYVQLVSLLPILYQIHFCCSHLYSRRYKEICHRFLTCRKMQQFWLKDGKVSISALRRWLLLTQVNTYLAVIIIRKNYNRLFEISIFQGAKSFSTYIVLDTSGPFCNGLWPVQQIQ